MGGELENIVSKILNVGEESPFSTFVDSRDNQEYTIVKIGDEWWFAENLNYNLSTSVYHPDDVNEEYGRLYSSEGIGACPPGWGVPNSEDWKLLEKELGGYAIIGGKLKEKGLDHWNPPNIGATNEGGFSAWGGGYFSGYENQYLDFKEKAVFLVGSLGKVIKHDSEEIYSIGHLQDKYSVRCVKD